MKRVPTSRSRFTSWLGAIDRVASQRFVYERLDEGIAIWSLGHNGVDDGGSDPSGGIDAEYAPIDRTNELPKPDGPDDVVVMLPASMMELSGVAP